jgi:RNA methyltransferase, TrmH family
MGAQSRELGPAINSPNNDKIKLAKALQRRKVRYKEKKFLVEGIRLVEDALRAGYVPALVFWGPEQESSQRAEALLQKILTVTTEVFAVGPHIIKLLSDTVTPQGIVAVFPIVELNPPRHDFLLILDGIQDPGNFGTLLRSAEAAGVDQVIVAPGTVDAFNPKVVRAGAGAHFRMPLIDLGWREIADLTRCCAVRLAEGSSPVVYYAVDWRGPVALIVGNEGAGPSQDARRLAAQEVGIPMKGGTESLNAGVAGSIILLEAARQRTQGQ